MLRIDSVRIWLVWALVAIRYSTTRFKRSVSMAYPKILESQELKVELKGGKTYFVQEWPWAAGMSFLKFARSIVKSVLDSAKRYGGDVKNIPWRVPKLNDQGLAEIDENGRPVMSMNIELLIEVFTETCEKIADDDSMLFRAIDGALICEGTASSKEAELRALRMGDIIQLLTATIQVNFSDQSSLGNVFKSLRGEEGQDGETPSSASTASGTTPPTSSPTPPPSAGPGSPPTIAPPSSAPAVPPAS